MNSEIEIDKRDLKSHWDDVYSSSPQEKLGWYESDLEPTLNLIGKTNITKDTRILIAGACCATLVDHLLAQGFKNIIATDISRVALHNLEPRIEEGIEVILDDLTRPSKLNNMDPVDLWIDRAFLHFFTDENDLDSYFDLLKRKVIKNGFVLLAEYNLNWAVSCSGLPVRRYNAKMLGKKLSNDFKLIDSFDYKFIMPSGVERPFIYTLFNKIYS